ncbi:MAG: TetR/AcrR family transcriptional regulator [Sulfuricella denitrificans]|nr:TetR/AcrR family transcriptional regulator [Sulfuricella denitrificans]
MIAKGQDNRQSIVNAANELFYRRGYNQTSFAEIADASGIPKGNFYYYFKSKDELLEAVIAERVQQVKAMLVEWDAQFPTPRERLQRFLSMLLASEEELTRHGCPMGTLNMELGKIQQTLQSRAMEMFEVFINWLTCQLDALGHGEETSALAMHLMARVQGISLMTHAYSDPVFLRREVAQLRNWVDQL